MRMMMRTVIKLVTKGTRLDGDLFGCCRFLRVCKSLEVCLFANNAVGFPYIHYIYIYIYIIV